MERFADAVLKPLLFMWLWVESVLTSFLEVAKTLATFLRIRSFACKFPVGEKTRPLLGHMQAELVTNKGGPLPFILNLTKKNKAGVIWFGSIPVFYLWDPRDLERVFCNSKSQEKGQIYRILEGGLGKGLVTSGGELWHRHNKIIAPAFRVECMTTFVRIFNDHTDVYLSILRDKADGKSFDIYHCTGKMTLDGIVETLMGVNVKLQMDSSNKILDYIGMAQESMQYQLIRPWIHPRWLYNLTPSSRQNVVTMNLIHDFTGRVLRERKAMLLAEAGHSDAQNGKKRSQVFADRLLSAQAAGLLTDQEITEEIDTFLSAGYETTALLIGYTLFETARNPHVQEKVVEELESLYDPSSSTINVTYEDLGRLTYLEMTLKETLRLHPPIPIVARRVGEDIRLATNNLVIPANADVGIFICHTHKDPEFFTDPENYDPERFSPENSRNRHPLAFVPFTSGQRICIGRRLGMMEAKVAVAKTLWQYKVFPDPDFVPEEVWGVSSRPINGLHLRMQLRREC